MTVSEYVERDPNLQEFFAQLPRSALSQLLLQHYTKGMHLFSCGDPPDNVYLITYGVCNCFLYTPFSMIAKSVHTLGYMDITGFHEVANNLPRLGTVVARTDVIALCIPKDLIAVWLTQQPRFMIALTSNIVSRMYQIVNYNSYCTKFSAKCGVVSIILHEWEVITRYKKESGFILPFSQQEIAEMLGKNIRSVNRVIKELKEMKLICVKSHKISISATHIESLEQLRMQEVEKTIH